MRSTRPNAAAKTGLRSTLSVRVANCSLSAGGAAVSFARCHLVDKDEGVPKGHLFSIGFVLKIVAFKGQVASRMPYSPGSVATCLVVT